MLRSTDTQWSKSSVVQRANLRCTVCRSSAPTGHYYLSVVVTITHSVLITGVFVISHWWCKFHLGATSSAWTARAVAGNRAQLAVNMTVSGMMAFFEGRGGVRELLPKDKFD
jgi:hypothetical protein